MKNCKTARIFPKEYAGAFRNPLKGFRGKTDDWRIGKYTTLIKTYHKWRDLEKSGSDGVEAIKAHCGEVWKDVEKFNVKVIPRPYLEWPNNGDHTKATKIYRYWPDDMEQGDITSNRFKKRVVRFVEKLAEAWDDDPRVAYVEMGIIGLWGEHHDPDVSPEMQKILGDAFTANFKNKLVMVRHPWDFKDYGFGVFWDSFAHADQENHAKGILEPPDRWKHAVIGGETAYNWGNYIIQPGDNPDDTLRDPYHRAHFFHQIRRLHANHLGWISEYGTDEKCILKAADETQKMLGYRFVIEKVEYPAEISAGGELEITFDVRNTGSSPLYYNWPVEVSLLGENREPVWKDVINDLDIRTWLPGDGWDQSRRLYSSPSETYAVRSKFRIPSGLPSGKYVLALAILDPGGNIPSARFAICNYFRGGRHPIGYLGVDCEIGSPEIPEGLFDSLKCDDSLYYHLNLGSQSP